MWHSPLAGGASSTSIDRWGRNDESNGLHLENANAPTMTTRDDWSVSQNDCQAFEAPLASQPYCLSSRQEIVVVGTAELFRFAAVQEALHLCVSVALQRERMVHPKTGAWAQFVTESWGKSVCTYRPDLSSSRKKSFPSLHVLKRKPRRSFAAKAWCVFTAAFCRSATAPLEPSPGFSTVPPQETSNVRSSFWSGASLISHPTPVITEIDCLSGFRVLAQIVTIRSGGQRSSVCKLFIFTLNKMCRERPFPLWIAIFNTMIYSLKWKHGAVHINT